jgi:hypothetical protein
MEVRPDSTAVKQTGCGDTGKDQNPSAALARFDTTTAVEERSL